MNVRDLWLRLRALLFPRRVESDLQDELDFHVEMQIQKEKAQGLSTEEARIQTFRRFGNASAVAEQCRDERRVQLIDNLVRDVRYALRQFGRSPLFTLIALLSLAIGIGANTALFTVFDSLYLQKLPVPEPDDLVSFRWRAFGEQNALVPQRVYGSVMTTSEGTPGGNSHPAHRSRQKRLKSFGALPIFQPTFLDSLPFEPVLKSMDGHAMSPLSWCPAIIFVRFGSRPSWGERLIRRMTLATPNPRLW